MNEVAGKRREMMKRGNFLRLTTGGLVTTVLAAPALAQTPPQVSWRLFVVAMVVLEIRNW